MAPHQPNTSQSPQAVAEALRSARETRIPIDPVGEPFSSAGIDLAYQIQDINTDHDLAQGRRLVGRKIGLTSPAVQRQLGVDQPDYGMLFADMAHMHNDEISLATLIQPKIEAEVALVLRKDIHAADTTLPELMDSIDYLLPALEIVDSRVKDWKIDIFNTVADNASSAFYVLGAKPARLRDVDLALCGMMMSRNGVELSTGCGAACLGHPLRAALWLARRMAAHGRPLQAGDTILTGALGPMAALASPGRVEASINGLGQVGVTFTE